MSRTTYLCENCNYAIADGSELVAAQTLADAVLAAWKVGQISSPSIHDSPEFVVIHAALVEYERVKGVKE